MQLGFVNFNTEEKKRVSKMMQILQESEAIEELGIGRVRDHFSNTLFPGTSTLQHHAKYLAVLPSLYFHTAYGTKNYQNVREVEKDIREAEIEITRQLAYDGEGNRKQNLKGITGIDTIDKAIHDYTKFVKYNPTYIYGSGMARYGIIPNSDIYHLILEINKKNRNNPNRKKERNVEDSTGNDAENSGEKQIISTSGEAYDFLKGSTMSLALSRKEAEFLKGKIENSCQKTMLSYLLSCDKDIADNAKYFEIEDVLNKLDAGMHDVYVKSVLFSKLMHLIDWRYNYAYFDSFGNYARRDKSEDGYFNSLNEYEEAINDTEAYRSLFEYIRPYDGLLTDFCEACYKAITEKEPTEVDVLAKAREYAVKRERSKIGNASYRNQDRINPRPNEFRWETVRTMVNEIRNPQ